MMMTGREYLEYIRTLSVELRIKEERIEQLRKDICSLQAIDYSKDRISGSVSSDIADKIARLDEMIQATNKEWDKLINERECAERLIYEIINIQERRVLQLRYIFCKSWGDIENKIKLSRMQTFRIHKTAVNHFDSLYKKKIQNVT